MGFYEYDVTSIRRAFRYKAARSVVLNPLFGRWWLKQDIPEVLSKLRRLWHKRLLVLQKAGWTRLAVGNGKFPYAANCPPFGVTTDQQGRVCKLLACPFCHARKALDAFMQLEWVLYGSFEPEATPRRSDVVLVDFRTRRTLQPGYDEALGVRKRNWHHPGAFRSVVLRAVQIIDSDRRNEVLALGPIGGVVFHRVVPAKRKGLCRFVRSGILICEREKLVQAGYVAGESERFDSVVQDVSKINLFKAVTRTFGYPLAWMDRDPKDMIEYLDLMQGVRTLSYFGIVRGAKDVHDGRTD